MGFSRQEHWSGLPCPSPGDLPDPGIEPGSPALQANALPSEPPGKPLLDIYLWQMFSLNAAFHFLFLFHSLFTLFTPFHSLYSGLLMRKTFTF